MSTSNTVHTTLTNLHSDLATLLESLQTDSVLHSPTNESPSNLRTFHPFFLQHLPLLLTTQKAQAIHNLRLAYITVSHIASSAPEPLETRFTNFGTALLWALDHADTILQSPGQPEIMKAVSTIFHLVAGLCYRECVLDQPSVNHLPQSLDAVPIGPLPSNKDPVYEPPQKLTLKQSRTPHIIHTPSHQVIHGQDFAIFMQTSDAVPFCTGLRNLDNDATPKHAVQPISMDSAEDSVTQMEDVTTNTRDAEILRTSRYIRDDGKHIMPDACIQETAKGCVIPFELHVQQKFNNEIDTIFDLLTSDAHVSYPDKSSFQYMPVQNIRLLRHNTSKGAFEGKSNGMATVEMSSKVYETIIDLCKEAYIKQSPGLQHIFLTDTPKPTSETCVKIEIPMLEDCFARVAHLLWFMECPLWKALEMCEHDVFGCGLFKVEFMEAPDGTMIVISLAGVVVERNFLNYSDKIFELLDIGVASVL